MASTHIDIDAAPWTVGTAFCGSAAIYQGREIVQVKLLSDRRSEGGGSAWLVKFSPPPGKLMKIVATAQSDEHVFNLEGGRLLVFAVPLPGNDVQMPPSRASHPRGRPVCEGRGIKRGITRNDRR